MPVRLDSELPHHRDERLRVLVAEVLAPDRMANAVAALDPGRRALGALGLAVAAGGVLKAGHQIEAVLPSSERQSFAHFRNRLTL